MIDSTRYPRLSRIAYPADLRTFGEDELPAIAEELRAYLIESVGRSGGHFGAGLGVIELTVALHWLYDTPHDRLVWDVGHQTYPHKILTGRRDTIHTVKQKDGVAPFPKREESEYDTFGVGHSSTSISAALGMDARATGHADPAGRRRRGRASLAGPLPSFVRCADRHVLACVAAVGARGPGDAAGVPGRPHLDGSRA